MAGTPILTSRIAGNVGLLGENYLGYFDVGDTEALSGLIFRAETDYAFLERLKSHCEKLAANFAPTREQKSWKELLGELGSAVSPGARASRLRSRGLS